MCVRRLSQGARRQRAAGGAGAARRQDRHEVPEPGEEPLEVLRLIYDMY